MDKTRKIGVHELNRKKDGELQMSRKQVNDYMDVNGVDKQMRDKYREVEEKLLDEALQVAADEVTESNDLTKAVVSLGRGDGKKFVTVHGKKEYRGRNPTNGENFQITKYGHCDIQEKRMFSPSLRDQRIGEIQRDCEKAFQDFKLPS